MGGIYTAHKYISWDNPKNILFGWLFLCLMVYNATSNNILSYIVAVSFIGGGNRSTQRKPLGRDRMLIGFIQLPMQYVPITNNVVSSNLDHG
jgi:hypothetical protein